jgi:hypothetical protein
METSPIAEGVLQRTSRFGDLNPLVSHPRKPREYTYKQARLRSYQDRSWIDLGSDY